VGRHLLAGALIVAGVTAAVVIALTGGTSFAVGGLRISLRSPLRALLIAALGFALLFRAGSRDLPGDLARAFLVALIGIAATLWLVYQVRTCGGLDSYGYVSAASLIADGRLHQREPLAAVLPFDNALRALAPLGYVVSGRGDTVVPRFPLGFPAVMALALPLGSAAVFMVPFALALGSVIVAYYLARDITHALGAQPPGALRASRSGAPPGTRPELAGLLAAILVAVDPVVFNQAIQPLSDVPAAFWLILSAWLLGRSPPWPVTSGIAAGLAMMTRPALVIAVVALGASALLRPGRTFARFVVCAGAVAVFQALLNTSLYGHPLVSGYGDTAHMFSVTRLSTNVVTYARWMTYAHGVAVVAALGLSLVILRRLRWIWTLVVVAGSVAAPYFLYFTYNDWEATRFLLPGTVLLLPVCASGILALLERRVPTRWVPVVALSIAVFLGSRSYLFVERHGVFGLRQAELKYPRVGNWFTMHTTSDAIVVSSLHSGSIRYYGGRTTLRWDEIPPGSLEATARALQRQGLTCYLALDGPEEEALFRARFASELNQLQFMPGPRLHGINIVTIEPR
jgi:hypothetical protein